MWAPRLSGVNPLSLPGAFRLMRTGSISRACGVGRGYEGAGPPATPRDCAPQGLCARALRAQQGLLHLLPAEAWGGREAPPHGNGVPEGLTGPSSEDPSPQAHSRQPLWGAWTYPYLHAHLHAHLHPYPSPWPLVSARPLCCPHKGVVTE